jgi:GMP synthase (glutamine-hydrolysing)
VFTRLFASGGVDATIVPYSVVDGEFPDDVESVDGWLTTGSPHFVTDDEPWIHRLADFVRRTHGVTPFVGICFGHQMIAHALGGKAGRSPRGWGVGVRPAYVVEAEPWMDPLIETVRLYHSHSDQVLTLPPDGVVLAGSPHCPVGIMQVGETTVGFQGHPEFNRTFADLLITVHEQDLSPAEVAGARAGIDGPTDEATVARWIANFVTG